MHHIFISKSQMSGDVIVINKSSSNDEYRHLCMSLRVNVGEKILCSVMEQDDGFDLICEVRDMSGDELTLNIIKKTKNRELKYNINLYQAISKQDKMEFIIEKATELGVASFTPISTEFCVAKISASKEDKKIDRYKKIAKSAAEQSKRSVIPKINSPITYKELMNNLKEDDINILFYENAEGINYTREALANIKKSDAKNINIIIGSEGGFSDNEVKLAKDKNLKILSLGDRILRVETAAVTAMSILMYVLN